MGKNNQYMVNNLKNAEVYILNGNKKEKCGFVMFAGGYKAAMASCAKNINDGNGGKRYPKGSKMLVKWPSWHKNKKDGNVLIICQAVPYIYNEYSYLVGK